MSTADGSGLEVSLKFKNSVTNLDKLKEYSEQLNKIKVSIQAMDTGAQKSLPSFNNNVDKSANSLKNLTNSSIMSNIKKTYVSLEKAFNIAKIVAYAKSMFGLTEQIYKFTNYTADLIEAQNLTDVAFKNNTTEADKFINKLVEMYGLDNTWAVNAVGTFKALANAMGLSDEVGTQLSKTMTQLAIDTSSLYNLDVDDAVSMLKSGLAGQTKPVRQIGADITQSTLQQFLTDNGITKAVSNLTYAEKRLVIVSALTDQVRDSWDDWGRTIESVANQERILGQQTQRLTTALGKVFLPTIKTILPYLNAFVMMVTEIINWFAKLIGYSDEDYDYFSGVDSSVSDLVDDLDDATSSSNKLKKSLRGFDELNNLTSSSSSSSSGTSGIDSDILELFNTTTDEYLNSLSNVKMKATEIRDTIMEWLGFTKEINEETEEVSFTYDTVGKTSVQIANELGTNLGKMLNYFTDEWDASSLGLTIANGVNTALEFVTSFVETYDWYKLGTNIANGINSAVENINWSDVGKLITDKFRLSIITFAGLVTTLDWSEIGKSIADVINSAFENIPAEELVTGVNALAKGIIKAFKTIVTNLDWSEIGTTLVDVLTGLDWEAWALLVGPTIIKKFGTGFASILSGTGNAITNLISNKISSLFNVSSAVSSTSSATSKISTFKIPSASTILQGFKDLAIIVGGVEVLTLALGLLDKIPGWKTTVQSGVEAISNIFTSLTTSIPSITAATVGVIALSKIDAKEVVSGLSTLAIIIGGFEVFTGITGAIVSIGSIKSVITTGIDTMVEIFNKLNTILVPLSVLTVGVIALGAVMTGSGGIGFGAIALGLVGLAEVVAGFEVVLAAAGAIYEKFGTLIDDGGKALSSLGSAIGGFIGGIYGGIVGGVAEGVLESITDILPTLGSKLSEFMTNAQPFFSGLSNVNSDSLESVKTLAETLIILTKQNIIESLTSWFAGETDLVQFGKDIAEFAPYFKEYSDAIQGIDSSTIEASSNAAQSLAELYEYLPKEGGVWQSIAGSKSLGLWYFASCLPTLGKNLKSYGDNVSGLNSEIVVASADAAKSLAEIYEYIPHEGGIWQSIAGSKSQGLWEFSEALPDFGKNLKSYGDNISGIDANIVTASGIAAQSLAELANKIPNTGGLVSLFTGDNTLADFGENLEKFGWYFGLYYNLISPMDISRLNSVANNIMTLINAFIVIKDQGLNNTIVNFGSSLKSAGSGIASFFSSELDENKASSIGKTFGKKLASAISSAFKNNFSATISIKDGKTTLKNVKIKAYADGLAAGLPSVGQLFVANEKGPELVGSLGGQSFVANQQQIMNMINGGTKQPINLTVIEKIDSKEISRKTLKNLQDMASADGKPIEIGG